VPLMRANSSKHVYGTGDGLARNKRWSDRMCTARTRMLPSGRKGPDSVHDHGRSHSAAGTPRRCPAGCGGEFGPRPVVGDDGQWCHLGRHCPVCP